MSWDPKAKQLQQVGQLFSAVLLTPSAADHKFRPLGKVQMLQEPEVGSTEPGGNAHQVAVYKVTLDTLVLSQIKEGQRSEVRQAPLSNLAQSSKAIVGLPTDKLQLHPATQVNIVLVDIGEGVLPTHARFERMKAVRQFLHGNRGWHIAAGYLSIVPPANEVCESLRPHWVSMVEHAAASSDWLMVDSSPCWDPQDSDEEYLRTIHKQLEQVAERQLRGAQDFSDFATLKLAGLRQALQDRHLPSTGTKAEMVERLREYDLRPLIEVWAVSEFHQAKPWVQLTETAQILIPRQLRKKEHRCSEKCYQRGCRKEEVNQELPMMPRERKGLVVLRDGELIEAYSEVTTQEDAYEDLLLRKSIDAVLANSYAQVAEYIERHNLLAAIMLQLTGCGNVMHEL